MPQANWGKAPCFTDVPQPGSPAAALGSSDQSRTHLSCSRAPHVPLCLLPALQRCPRFSVPAWLLSPYSLPLIFIRHLIATHTLTVMFCRIRYNRKREHPDILLTSPVCYFKQHQTYPSSSHVPSAPSQCYRAADSFSFIRWLLLLSYISLSLVTLIQHVCRKAAT